MFKTKRNIFIIMLTLIMVIICMIVTLGYDSYRDPILNYVPHSADYLKNDPENKKVPPAKKPKHVVMIGVDGVGGYALKSGYSPNMNYLMHHGAYTLQANNVLPTSSAANWASAMFATDPVKHGVVDQDLWNVHHTVHSQVESNQISIFRALKDKFATQQNDKNLFGYASEGEMISSFTPKDKKEDEIATLVKENGVFVTTENDEETFKATKEVLHNKPKFSFFYYVNPDLAGHSREWNSEEYYQSITEIDKYIGGTIEELKTIGIWDDTLLIITSDHGGVSQYHGHAANAEREIPLLFFGNCIPKHGIIPDKITIYDVPATIAWLLDGDDKWDGQPKIWDGQPILTPFFDMYNMYDHSEDKE